MKIEYRMNINFNRGDLVSFGEFLLSESRRERFANSETEASLPLEERLSMVHHADVENWLEERGKVSNPKKRKFLNKMYYANAAINH